MGIRSFIFSKLLQMGKNKGNEAFKKGHKATADKLIQNIKQMNKMLPLFIKPRAGAVSQNIQLKGTPTVHTAFDTPKDKTILYIHGGAYIYSLTDVSAMYKPIVTELAYLAKADVFAIDYRVAPKDTFPAPLEDAYNAYLALLERGIDPKTIFISGDSAGGGITLALLLKIRDEGKPLPKAAIPLSAWTDLTFSGPSNKAREPLDPIFPEGGLENMAEIALRGQDPKDPYISPLFGKYEGLPPMLMLVGGREVLYDDTIRVAKKAKDAGVDITLDIEESMFHVYPVFFGIFKEGKMALDRMVNFMDQRMKD